MGVPEKVSGSKKKDYFVWAWSCVKKTEFIFYFSFRKPEPSCASSFDVYQRLSDCFIFFCKQDSSLPILVPRRLDKNCNLK